MSGTGLLLAVGCVAVACVPTLVTSVDNSCKHTRGFSIAAAPGRSPPHLSVPLLGARPVGPSRPGPSVGAAVGEPDPARGRCPVAPRTGHRWGPAAELQRLRGTGVAGGR